MKECKGLIYRGNVSLCQTNRGVLFQIRLNELKRKSCSGCPKCEFLRESLGELDINYYPLLGLEKVKQDGLYTIRAINLKKDWETGHVDDWDLEVVEIE